VSSRAKHYDSICAVIFSAIVNENMSTLAFYKDYDLNALDTHTNETFLQAAIRYNKPKVFDALVEYGINMNNASPLDGTTALHEAVRLDSTHFINQLVNLGANVNVQDSEGFTPLNHALSFEKYSFAEILLKVPGIDVNIPAANGATPIWYAFEYGNAALLNKIMNHSSFDPTFTQMLLKEYNLLELSGYLVSQGKGGDVTLVNAYSESKLFGLKFDLGGCMPLDNFLKHEYECFSFDGYYRNKGAIVLADSYNQFYSNVIENSEIPSWAGQAFISVKEAVDFSASIFDPAAYYEKMKRGELLIIPSGWEEHAITFVINKDTLYRCNRGDESDGIHGIEEFKITKLSNFNVELIEQMLNWQGESHYLQYDLIDILGLEKIGMVENPAQAAGNCVWTSLETSVEAAFISTFKELGIDNNTAHQLAKQSFIEWEEFDLTYTLKKVIDQKEMFIAADIYDDLLIRALEAHHNPNNEYDVQRGLFSLNELNSEVEFALVNQPFVAACNEYKSKIATLPIDINDVMMNSFIDGFEAVFSPSIPTSPVMILNHTMESTEHIL
jgi:hypothetical protein